MQGGMAGSHLRWSVYEDMVNLVWPQCDEQERRDIFLIMRRDLGTYWRPAGWRGMEMDDFGEGEWRRDIIDVGETPWKYFRQVLARFNPDNQYAVTMKVDDRRMYEAMVNSVPMATIIERPVYPLLGKDEGRERTMTVRAYLWEKEYRIDWSRRCAEDSIKDVRKMDLVWRTR